MQPLTTAPAGVTSPPEPHVPGEVGLWILLFGDMTVFAILFGVYLQHRGEQPALFAHSQDALNRDFGAINTLVLLTSSLLVVLANRAIRGPSRHLAPRLLLGALGLGATFIVIKALEYHDRIAAGDTPDKNTFFMFYFVLTGLHLAHLVFGMAVLTVLTVIARKPQLSETQLMLFEGGACFWHMVDLLWIIIFPLIFLVR